ncbi:hypothetical protein VVMO6_03274 [Vibrio vulnificus MO6-24/O]|nr:hypothetical protein VVMO6_03274 [Vibrio vulnificus MO6-24/O]
MCLILLTYSYLLLFVENKKRSLIERFAYSLEGEFCGNSSY